MAVDFLPQSIYSQLFKADRRAEFDGRDTNKFPSSSTVATTQATDKLLFLLSKAFGMTQGGLLHDACFATESSCLRI